MRHALGLLFGVLAAISPIHAQDALTPQADELRLEGVIAGVDWPARRLSFAATHFVLPSGKGGAVKALKPKTILLPDATQFYIRGDWKFPIETARVKPGQFAVITGSDAGGGQPLTARIVAVWDKVEGEIYSLATPETAAPAVQNPAPETLPATAPEPILAAPPVVAPKVLTADELANLKTINQILSSDFETLGEDNRAEDWHYANRQSVQFIENDEGHFVSLNTREGERKISRTVKLDPAWKTLKVTARVRGHNLQRGKEIWANAHIGFEFRNDKNEVTGYGFPVNLNTDSDWRILSGIATIPEGSTSATLDAGNFGADGIFDVDDITMQHDIGPDALPLIAGFPEGSFETLEKDGAPRGWNLFGNAGVELIKDGDNRFLRLTNPPPNAYLSAEGLWQLKPGTKTVKISAKMRVRDLVKGKEGWQTARVGLAFNKLNGEAAGGWPPSLELQADTDWKTLSETLTVPPDALFLKITPQFLNANGSMDVDDIQVEHLK